MRPIGIVLLALVIMAPALALAGEPTGDTVYLAPRQTLPLLAQPALGTTTGRSVSTEDALLVVARQGEFLQVRTPDGALGWVRTVNTTTSAPRSETAARAENAELANQVRTLDEQIRAFQAENAALRVRLMQLEGELAVLTRPVPMTLSGVRDFLLRLIMDGRFWLGLGALLVALLLAFLGGVRWRNRRIRDRFGGLDL